MAGQTECTIRTLRSGEENMTKNGELMVSYMYCKIFLECMTAVGRRIIHLFSAEGGTKSCECTSFLNILSMGQIVIFASL